MSEDEYPTDPHGIPPVDRNVRPVQPAPPEDDYVPEYSRPAPRPPHHDGRLLVGAIALIVILLLMYAVLGNLFSKAYEAIPDALDSPAVTSPSPTPRQPVKTVTAKPSPRPTVTTTQTPSLKPNPRDSLYTETGELTAVLDDIYGGCEWREVDTFQVCDIQALTAQVSPDSKSIEIFLDKAETNSAYLDMPYVRGENWIVVTDSSFRATKILINLGGERGRISE